MIYLDHNATTRPSPAVIEAVRHAMENLWANPSSVHRAGQEVRRAVELARQAIADLIGVTIATTSPPKARDITFTSGGTESIDLCIRGTIESFPSARRVLATTRIEHASVRDIAQQLERQQAGSVHWLALAGDGVVDLLALARDLDGPAGAHIGLVSVQWANNETGVIQPVEQISRLCRERGVLFHCDATQFVGKEVASSPAAGSDAPFFDLLTFAPHKFRGPKGVGVACIRQGVRVRPRLLGTQELGRRSGTENVPGILGAGVAAHEAIEWLKNPAARAGQAALRDRFEQRVLAGVPGAVINAGAPRLWNTTNIGFPRLEAEALLMLLSERGVCASAGAACSSGSLEPSPVLLAMGIPEPIAHGSVRFSLGRDTTSGEIDQAAEIVIGCVRKLRESMPN